MPEPLNNTPEFSFDKQQLKKDVEEAMMRVGRAGLQAVVDGASKELARLQAMLSVARDVLKPNE